jgi:SAM-dependent methyltransferase
MKSHILEELATEDNFDEEAYLLANPDVAQAVKKRLQKSGKSHFQIFGKDENRRLRRDSSFITETRRNKHQAIRSLLRSDLSNEESECCYDFLTGELKKQFNIVDTDLISGHNYGQPMIDLINKYESGWVLDCGAGRRPVYYENVVNFEIVPYDTTDVCGVGEILPFVDHVFDAVISVAVLEHVKNPFLCAKEIARVLKPGGELICCVPFLQPLHGYPHHYYNMTHQGLANLFEGFDIDRIEVPDSVLPIWSLTWILKSWTDGLTGAAKKEFLNLRVADLLEPGDRYLGKAFVRELPASKNLELASATVLFAHKR